MSDIVERLRSAGYDYDFHENALIHVAANEIESLRAQLEKAKVEIACEERRFSDLWEQLCATQAQLAEVSAQRSASNRKIEELTDQLAEVTRERDDYKQAVYDLGLTPEEARAGAKRSRDMKQQLLATKAHAARMGEVLRGIAKQTPEKPDYWSSCCQCEHNISDAEEAISTPINLDALHEDRAVFINDVAKHLLTEICFKMGSGSPYRKMLHDYIDNLRDEAAAHRSRCSTANTVAKKEGK